jgi:hypothetical protein
MHTERRSEVGMAGREFIKNAGKAAIGDTLGTTIMSLLV